MVSRKAALQTEGVPTGGLRIRLLGIGLGLAVIGAGFIAIAIWPFLLPAIADLRAGNTAIFTATRGAGITWLHVYAFRDHPTDFAIGILSKFLGAIAFGGLGLFLSLGGLFRAFGPADIQFSPRARRMTTAWIYGSIAAFILYLVLWVFPYLLRYGVLS